MKPIYDHFLVTLTQEDIDKENERVKAELERVKKAERESSRIITSTDSKDVEDKDVIIDHKVDMQVMTVAAIGAECDYVKPGDKVIVRAKTRPEVTKYKDKLYLSFSEKSVSLIVEDE